MGIEQPPGLFERIVWDGDRGTGYFEINDFAPTVAQLYELFGVRFTLVAWQAYRNGTGVDWHTDPPFDQQAIVSFGATRTFGIRVDGTEQFVPLPSGSAILVPTDAEHCIRCEHVGGVRVALVFRTPRR